MTERGKHYTGGCLCGALRYVADGEPLFMGHCYCADCRRASGSGFIPFMAFPSSAVRFNGTSRTFTSKAANGRDAVRNSCPSCSSLVFGGELGKSETFTIYAGSLDDPSSFHPKVAIFTRGRPEWAVLPPDIITYEAQPWERVACRDSLT
jgi:hypothetical protein